MMDWKTLVQRYRLREKVTGVLHCGAHLAEEAMDYDWAFGRFVPIWWVEANQAVFRVIVENLKRYPKQYLVSALLAEIDGAERDFHITNYDGMSSSLLEFGTHPQFSPDTVFVRHERIVTATIDRVAEAYKITANMLVMDLQGAEGMALAGAKQFLEGVEFVMSEVNRAEVYKGCAKVHELDEVLGDFDRVETLWTPFDWGDALWVRR
jgi:FkbM family methyltransferase